MPTTTSPTPRIIWGGPGTRPNGRAGGYLVARNAFISWEEMPGAVGYNILWGIKDDKLYQTYQVFADQGSKLELRALTIDQDYSFAIESFNETGVSKASQPVHLK